MIKSIIWYINIFVLKLKFHSLVKNLSLKTLNLILKKKCPAIMQYIIGSNRDQLEDDEWVIDLDFDTVKSFFDPVVNKILRLIEVQLSKCPQCSVLFLVGGFGESRYLQSRIKQKFSDRLKVASMLTDYSFFFLLKKRQRNKLINQIIHLLQFHLSS